MSNRVKIPLVLKPSKISNIFQVVHELRKLQNKNHDYSVLQVKTDYTSVLRPVTKCHDINAILNGFVSEKLKKMSQEHDVLVQKMFDKKIKLFVNNIKKQNKTQEHLKNIDLKNDNFEMKMDSGVTKYMFDNTMYYDLYTYLNSYSMSYDYDQEVSYLGIEYIKYIERFLKESATALSVPLDSIEDKISKFVKLRYTQEGCKLISYEGEYIYAKIYIYLRCGLMKLLFNLLNKYSAFLDRVDATFRKSLTTWIASKTPIVIDNLSSKEDRFKRFLYNLMQNDRTYNDRLYNDTLVIATVEDYLWCHLINIRTEEEMIKLREQFANYKSKNGLLLVYVMTKQYKKAMEYVFNSDMSPYVTYHLLQELARKCDDKTLFIEYTFALCAKISCTQKKVDLLSNLEQVNGNLCSVVPQLIVNYKIYDILAFFQNAEIPKQVVKILKDMNDRKQLALIYHLVQDDILLLDVLIDVFIEGILTNTNINEYIKIYENIKKDESEQIQKLVTLKKFYDFVQNPDITTLKEVAMFSLDFNIVEVKYVIEKVLRLSCEAIKKANDIEMANKLFKIVGDIELGDECVTFINKELITLF